MGTHCLRRANDKLQAWHRAGKKKKVTKVEEDEDGVAAEEAKEEKAYTGKPFRHCLRTEEGLACLNTCIRQPDKLLWRPALHYYAVCKAAMMSFAELYEAQPAHLWSTTRILIPPNPPALRVAGSLAVH